MEKYYRFAGVELAVTPPPGEDYADDDTLSPFRVDAVTDPHRFAFVRVAELSPAGQPLLVQLPDRVIYGSDRQQVCYLGQSVEQASMRCTHQDKTHFVELKQQIFCRGMTAKTLLNACAAEHLVAQAAGFILHASYIDRQGGGILFTAPSETGKSTQAALWQQYRGAQILNGDRAAVQACPEGIRVHGLPFSGSSKICVNRSLPLQAIVYLSQGPESTVRKLRGAEAFARVWEGISVNVWDKKDMEQVSATVQQVLAKVPVYHLTCTADETAVAVLEQALREQDYGEDEN